jgi:hypothetical protein
MRMQEAQAEALVTIGRGQPDQLVAIRAFSALALTW